MIRDRDPEPVAYTAGTLWNAAASRCVSVELFVPIYRPKSCLGQAKLCLLFVSWCLVTDICCRPARHRARSRHYSSHYKVMLSWIAVVGVAQLVERRSVAPNVAGSNPVSHPKILNIV